MNTSRASVRKGSNVWMWLMLVSVVAAGLVALQATPVAGQATQADLVVDDDRVECQDADFTSIQAAVDEAQRGAEIQVCPGTYEEYVDFNGSGKDNITLFSQNRRQAEINAPNGGEVRDLITVDDATGVTVRGFRITGPFPVTGCGQFFSGVFVLGNGSADILDNRITKIRSEDPSLRGCQTGEAVYFGASQTSGSGSVMNNRMDFYQKSGVVVNLEGSGVNVRDNDIFGIGPTPVTAQNGVQVGFRGRANVQENTIRNHVYTGSADDEFDAGGIILTNRPNDETTVRGNTVTENDYNIGLFGADRVEVSGNESTNSTKLAGIFVDENSRRNLFENNRALDNQEFDCRDRSDGTRTAGTANTWTNNVGVKDVPRDICRRP